MIRQTPYLKKANEQWQQLREQLNTTTLLLLGKRGPTVFLVKEENGETFKTIIGNPHLCECCPNSNTICIHIMFCLLKVLRVPDSHPYAFQSSLTDNELEIILSDQLNKGNESRRPKKKKIQNVNSNSTCSNDNNGFVPRQPLDDLEEEICSICQDSMNKDQPLTWCRKGCGNNIHAKCFRVYSQYNVSNRQDVLCPFCRSPWAMEFLQEDCRGKSSLKHSCAPAYCSTCLFTIRSQLFRCVECSQNACLKGSTDRAKRPVDFCPQCVNTISADHSLHHIITSDSSVPTIEEVEWRPYKNPKAPIHSMDYETLQSLQHRDISIEDYDMLLGLDAKLPPLPVHLMQSLPVVSSEHLSAGLSITRDSPLCWCESRSGTYRSLPCGHSCHDQCISSLITSSLSEEVSLDSIKCCHQDCNTRIFPGLSRRRKVSKTASASQLKDESTKKLSETSKNTGNIPLNGKSKIIRGSTAMAVGLGIEGMNLSIGGGGGIASQMQDMNSLTTFRNHRLHSLSKGNRGVELNRSSQGEYLPNLALNGNSCTLGNENSYQNPRASSASSVNSESSNGRISSLNSVGFGRSVRSASSSLGDKKTMLPSDIGINIPSSGEEFGLSGVAMGTLVRQHLVVDDEMMSPNSFNRLGPSRNPVNHNSYRVPHRFGIGKLSRSSSVHSESNTKNNSMSNMSIAPSSVIFPPIPSLSASRQTSFYSQDFHDQEFVNNFHQHQNHQHQHQQQQQQQQEEHLQHLPAAPVLYTLSGGGSGDEFDQEDMFLHHEGHEESIHYSIVNSATTTNNNSNNNNFDTL